jgi:hypothetical protein
LLASLAWLVTVLAISAGVLAAQPRIEPVETSSARSPAARGSDVAAAGVLRAWDAQRALAWAHGDVRALTALYTRGSAAGRRDRTMLRAWVARGLVVRGMATQLLAVREVRRTASTWTLRVTDRLVGGDAVGRGARRPLPNDAPTIRTVELRRVGGSWLVSAVQPIEPGP